MKNYYEILRELREDKDLKQESIAKFFGITKQQYSLYKTGKRKLPINMLKALSSFYGVSSDYILGLPENLKYIKR